MTTLDITRLLPAHVGGRELTYEIGPWQDVKLHATEPAEVLAVIEAAGRRRDELLVAIGSRTDQPIVAVSAWQVAGLDARELVDPLNQMWDFEDEVRWSDAVGGKEVARAGPRATPRERGIYIYAVEDVAVIVVTDSRALAKEFFASLP